jgi:hypothetical protein
MMRPFPRLSAGRRETLSTNLWLIPTIEVLCAVALFVRHLRETVAPTEAGSSCPRGSSAEARTRRAKS